MSEPVRLGVIGCGRVTERFYLPAFGRLSNARVVAVADRSQERRDCVSSRLRGCRAYASAEALLDQALVEGVIIATPPETHVALAEAALRRGLAVFIEKPLARSEGDEHGWGLLEAPSKCAVMMGFNRRHWEPVRRLREVLRAQRATPGLRARLVMAGNPRTWAAISDAADALDNQGCHQLDLVRYLFDREITAVSARWTEPHSITMRLVLSGGAVVECVAAHNGAPQETITVDSGGRRYRIRRGSERIHPAEGRRRAALDLFDTWHRRVLGRRSSLRRSYVEQFRRFAEAIRSGAVPEPGLADGIAALRTAQAARRSAARDGAEVTIS